MWIITYHEVYELRLDPQGCPDSSMLWSRPGVRTQTYSRLHSMPQRVYHQNLGMGLESVQVSTSERPTVQNIHAHIQSVTMETINSIT